MSTKIQQKKKKGISVQELIGIKAFTNYGILTVRGEMLFYSITPTNLSVLSRKNIDSKIHQLMLVLSAIPDIEIACTDSSECFDKNKLYLFERMKSENCPMVKSMLQKDILFLDEIQIEMATARQFMFIVRCRNMKPQQVFERANTVSKVISEHGFNGHRFTESEIKRFLALYFDASLYGEHLPDYDGSQYFDLEKLEQEKEKNEQKESN